MKRWEWVVLGGGALLAIWLFASKSGCTSCKDRHAAMVGAWPGAGPGVAGSPLP